MVSTLLSLALRVSSKSFLLIGFSASQVAIWRNDWQGLTHRFGLLCAWLNIRVTPRWWLVIVSKENIPWDRAYATGWGHPITLGISGGVPVGKVDATKSSNRRAPLSLLP